MVATTVVWCSDPLRPRRVDEHFAAEARAVRECGGGVALIDHDALARGEAEEAVARVPAGAGRAWYRGWMVPAERYAELDAALRRRGTELLTTPEQYRAAHELPGWYAEFAEVTPASGWLPVRPGEVPEAAALAALAARLPPGPGIVKDYVKSRKHEWDEACYVPELADTAALARVVRRFAELQGEYLAGGIVLRAFEEFTGPEVRIWWLDGEPALLTPHPDSPSADVPRPDLSRIAPAVRRLGCRFTTTDAARRADGAWRVVEVGDGQVSDAHPAADRAALARLLAGNPR